MKKQLVLSALALTAASISANAATFTTFSYSQSDATTGTGTIAPFSFSGHDFTATPCPPQLFSAQGRLLPRLALLAASPPRPAARMKPTRPSASCGPAS